MLAVGKPADAFGDVIPLPELGDELTGWLSPDDDSGGPGSFEALAQEDGGGRAARADHAGLLRPARDRRGRRPRRASSTRCS